ncbi:MAG: fumarylacetoacetate hydrolase family protein [Chloroflexi bacterium]|nr:fumarylacetoacetate hydrolase family protein [Chloroflexota bacterium]
MSDPIRAAAGELCAARQARRPFERFPETLRPADERAAYAVQDALHACLIAGGWGGLVGFKIGCTTPVMQAYLHIDSPCAGGIFASSVRHERGEFLHRDFVRVGVECELAVRIGASLPSQRAPFTRADVAAVVDACMAAIEVVDDRYADYSSLDTPTLIADDFFGAGCVLGAPVVGFDPFRLRNATASMTIDGTTVGSGVGTDILGEPLDALAWLASNLAARGLGLRSGDCVLLGSLVQTHWLTPGAEVLVQNEPLGEVRARFS